MVVKRRLHKAIDDEAEIRCAAGPGLLREEVWENEKGEIVRYNLAFINHYMTTKDNGRVLGYDNAHGTHHRHFLGMQTKTLFTDYQSLTEGFYLEVAKLGRIKR